MIRNRFPLQESVEAGHDNYSLAAVTIVTPSRPFRPYVHPPPSG